MMEGLISRQAAINAVENTDVELTAKEWDELTGAIMSVPFAEPESCDMCDFCDGLESGDKLFQISDWDGGIGFDYIYIKYCPMCGRRL